VSRYCFYIDGFNVYYALNGDPALKSFPYRKYKWLDYRKLAESITGQKDTIAGIFYFTAFVRWKTPDVVYRHKQYIKALRAVEVETIQGRFMDKHIKCHNCNKYFSTHEEKRTDVNIALKLLGDAFDNLYDKALIISADSDLLPVIQTIHKYFPDKEIGVMFPIGRTSFDLRQHADFRRKMRETLLQDSQFPDEVKVGSEIIKRPDSWR
jgi:uncharacterized LabA/DUF88 family protein